MLAAVTITRLWRAAGARSPLGRWVAPNIPPLGACGTQGCRSSASATRVTMSHRARMRAGVLERTPKGARQPNPGSCPFFGCRSSCARPASARITQHADPVLRTLPSETRALSDQRGSLSHQSAAQLTSCHPALPPRREIPRGAYHKLRRRDGWVQGWPTAVRSPIFPYERCCAPSHWVRPAAHWPSVLFPPPLSVSQLLWSLPRQRLQASPFSG